MRVMPFLKIGILWELYSFSSLVFCWDKHIHVVRECVGGDIVFYKHIFMITSFVSYVMLLCFPHIFLHSLFHN